MRLHRSGACARVAKGNVVFQRSLLEHEPLLKPKQAMLVLEGPLHIAYGFERAVVRSEDAAATHRRYSQSRRGHAKGCNSRPILCAAFVLSGLHLLSVSLAARNVVRPKLRHMAELVQPWPAAKRPASSPVGARWPCSVPATQKRASAPALLAYLDRVQAAVGAVKQQHARMTFLLAVVVEGDATSEAQVEVRKEGEGYAPHCTVSERREALRVCSHFAVQANFMRDIAAEVPGYMFVQLGDKPLGLRHTHGTQHGHGDSGDNHALEDVRDRASMQSRRQLRPRLWQRPRLACIP